MDEIWTISEAEIRQLLAIALAPQLMVPIAAAAIAGLIRARLLLVAVAASAVASAWLWQTGQAVEALPLEACVAILLLGALGILEAVVILVGGRAAVPHFWALILAALFTLILIMPLRALAKGLGLLPGARALRTLLWPHR